MTSEEVYKTPKEKLAEEIKKLEGIKKIIDDNNAAKTESEKRKAALDKDVNDVTKVVEAYKNKFESIKEVQAGLAVYYEGMFSKIVDKVTELGKKEVIDEKKQKYDNETAALRKSLEKNGDLWREYDQAKTNFDGAQKAVNDALSEYDKLKKWQNEIEDNIKEIQNLKSMIDKSDELKDAGKRYFWISEIRTINDALPAKIIDPEEGDSNKRGLHYQLDHILDDLDKKNIKFKEADERLKNAETNYQNAQKELELREKNRRNAILQEINDLK